MSSNNYYNLNEESAPPRPLSVRSTNLQSSNIEMIPVQQYQPVVRPQVDEPSVAPQNTSTLRRLVKREICLKIIAWILIVSQ